MKYQVKTFVWEAGEKYRPGDEIELSEHRAMQLAHVLMDPVKEAEAPVNRMIGKKKTHLTKSYD
jgi:hypothetical protein